MLIRPTEVTFCTFPGNQYKVSCQVQTGLLKGICSGPQELESGSQGHTQLSRETRDPGALLSFSTLLFLYFPYTFSKCLSNIVSLALEN